MIGIIKGPHVEPIIDRLFIASVIYQSTWNKPAISPLHKTYTKVFFPKTIQVTHRFRVSKLPIEALQDLRYI